jgi:ABC-type nitrate/sulfonate/bicarbonate transport system substrate-binding protein
VNVQLDWTPNIDAAGFYVAEAKGYYAEQGLSVKLMAGGSDAQGNYIDMIETVLGGHADFGESSGIDLLQARARNAPLVAIATIYQRHPLSFSSLAEKRITKPQDLIGKTVQIAPNDRLLFQALLTSEGIDPAQIKTVERIDFTSAPLIKGEADVIDAWVTNENVILKQEGRAINTILPVEYGIEAYPNVIFTTEKMIAEHPDVVERFLRATLQGMQGAIDDPKSAALLAKQRDAALDLSQQTEAMFQAVPFLKPAGSRPGMMTDKTWGITERVMRDQGLLKQPLDIKAAYTLAFLDKVYPK